MSTILPPTWRFARLNEICAFNPKHSRELADSQMVSFVPMQAVDEKEGKIQTAEARTYGEIRQGYTHFADGDILFAKITPCMQNGKHAIATGLLNDLGCGSTEFFVLRPYPDIEAGYIHHFLRQQSFLRTAVDAMTGVVGQARVPREFLEKATIPIPPAQEQKRILWKVNALLARSRRASSSLSSIPELLARLRRAVLTAAFRGDLTADWRARNPDVEPADKFLKRIRAERRRRWEAAELARLTAKGKLPTDARWKDRYSDSNIPDMSFERRNLPETWTWASVSDLTECLDSQREPVKREEREKQGGGSFPYYGANGQVGTIDRYLFDEPLVLVTEDETFYGRVKPIAYRVEGKCWVNNHAHVLRVVPPMSIDFFHRSLMFYPVEPWLTGTSGRAKLTQGALNRLPIALAPAAESEVIATRLESALRRIETLHQLTQAQQSELVRIDRTLLAKAFRGELVPQDPNDEPASVLLERLRVEAATAPVKPDRRARTTASTDDGPPEPKPAAPRSHRRTTEPALTPSAISLAPSDPPPPVPVSRAGQQPLPLALPTVDFLELPADAQAERVHTVLLGEGPLEREDAVRRAADQLRDAGLATFQRLRRDGPLAACIDAAISVGLREGRFDRPSRGSVRAVAPEPATVPAALWRRALLAALESPHEADEAVRAAADWCQAQFGLDFKRLRTGGHIDTALRTALAELRAAGEVVEDGSGILSVRTRSAP